MTVQEFIWRAGGEPKEHELMADFGINQADVCALAGKTEGWFTKLKQKRNPQIGSLVEMLSALGLSMSVAIKHKKQSI